MCVWEREILSEWFRAVNREKNQDRDRARQRKRPGERFRYQKNHLSVVFPLNVRILSPVYVNVWARSRSFAHISYNVSLTVPVAYLNTKITNIFGILCVSTSHRYYACRLGRLLVVCRRDSVMLLFVECWVHVVCIVKFVLYVCINIWENKTYWHA